MAGNNRKERAALAKDFSPYRWEVLRDKYPDFDILIDDNPYIIKECIKNLPSDKVYAVNDYACNRELEKENNVLLFPTKVSNLEDSDFIYQPQTPKPKTEIKEIPAPKENIWKQPNTYLIFTSGFILTSLIGLGIYYLKIRKKNQKS
jgi:hypothetical protein